MRAPRPARSSSVTDPQARTSAAPLPFPFSLQRNAAAEITGEFAGILIPLRPAEISGASPLNHPATPFPLSAPHIAAPNPISPHRISLRHAEPLRRRGHDAPPRPSPTGAAH